MDLDNEVRLKVLSVVYAGRDGDPKVRECYYELLSDFTDPVAVVSQIAQKVHLAAYLREGLAIVQRERIDLDEPWPSSAPVEDTSALFMDGDTGKINEVLAATLDDMAHAARAKDRQRMTKIGHQVRSLYGEQGLRLARVVADTEGFKARDGGFVLAAVRDAFDVLERPN
jgi:hypothetical protein